jgi:hypothetical protein
VNASDPFAPQPGGDPDGGWSGSGAAVVAPPPPPVRRTGRGRAVWVEVAVAAMTALVIAAAGAPLAVAWWLIAPKVPIVVSSVGPVYVNYETERFMSADGWFVTLGAGAGVLVAIVCWLAVRYHRGPAMLAALVGGSVGAAVLASWLGGQIGRLDYDYLLRHAPAGAIFYHPVTLGARGGLLVQAALAVFVYTLIAGCSRFALLTKLRPNPTPTHQPNPLTPTAQPALTAQPWPPAQPPQQGQPGQPESQQPTATATFPVPSAGQPAPDHHQQQNWAQSAPDHQQDWAQAGPDQRQGWSQAGPDHQRGWAQAGPDQRQGWAPPAPDHQRGWTQPAQAQAQAGRPAGADHTGPFQPFGLPNESQARPDQTRPDQQGPSPVPPPSQQPYDPFAPPSPAGPTDWPR